MLFENKLYDAMKQEGLEIQDSIDWGSRDFQRFKGLRNKGNGKSIFVILMEGGASFGDWRNPSTWRTIWEKSYRELSDHEKSKRQDEINQLMIQKQHIKSHAIFRANKLIKYCMPALDNHPYIKLKRIKPYYGLQIRSCLIIPITDINDNLISLQYIKRNGFKQFKKNASPKGGMLIMGEVINKNDTIRICEGYSTGCSIYESIGSPVIVCFSASNLLEATLSVRTKYPLNQITICADNDKWPNKLGKVNNVGIENALNAAKLSGSKIVYPKFDKFDITSKPTDFNDLMILGGIEEVENQLLGN